MNEQELKPCPFCGDNLTWHRDPNSEDDGWYSCGCKWGEWINADRWNTRPIEDALQAEIDRQKEWNIKLSQSNVSLGQELGVAQAAIDRLRAALKIYADRNNWIDRGLGSATCYIWTRMEPGDFIASNALEGDE